MAFENKNPPLKSRGLPLVNKSHLLHPLAVLISQIECDRFFEVSASIDIDSYPGSLACELDMSIETWFSLIKAGGLTSKNRLNNPVVDYKNWCEVLGLEKKKSFLLHEDVRVILKITCAGCIAYINLCQVSKLIRQLILPGLVKLRRESFIK